MGCVNSKLRVSTRWRVCVGLAKGGALTVKSKAGMGVQRFTWIMASTLGRWPSLAPAKNSLAERKAGQPRMAHGPPKDAPSPAGATSSMPSFCPGASPLQPGTRLLMHTFQPTSHRTHNHKCRCRQNRGRQWISGWIPGTLSVAWMAWGY